MTAITTLIFGDLRLQTQVLKALGDPMIIFAPRGTPRLEISIASERIFGGMYFVDGERDSPRVATLHRLQAMNHVFPSGQIYLGGWHPTGETIELQLE